MKIFDIPILMETIAEEIRTLGQADPAKVNLLIQEGPAAVEHWVDAIEVVKAEADVIKKRIAELKERMDARNTTATRMGELLRDVMDMHFDGRIKTPLVTVWNQDTLSYDVTATDESPYWVVEKKLDKKTILADIKDGKKPEGVTVEEKVSRSIRIRR